ncbi:MarR family winged helix-turn-helix transcriptional regulator [Tahibacter amnicola]|uniref:MarR family transcriptional regulator n=1 Tax=Tahibacter amnicola TaxID=2976241 RepID=A0ABY6B9A1_9GAMM|nr:MarR family transcriptional regulator [Tahibacter amnicola]UXI66638.1 MarR family transcriptional regulator [Tahibacter amnicola]
MKRTLGTQLRHLIELLDGAVEASYAEAGLRYRPRFTPIVRALTRSDALTIGQLAAEAGITQPAATQTVALMLKEGLVVVETASGDARQKQVSLSAQGRALLPALQTCWQSTERAARGLEHDIGVPLSELIERAIQALAAKPFADRLRDARAQLADESLPSTPPHTAARTRRR